MNFNSDCLVTICVKYCFPQERQKKLERIKQHLAECDVRSEALASEKQIKLQHRQEMVCFDNNRSKSKNNFYISTLYRALACQGHTKECWQCYLYSVAKTNQCLFQMKQLWETRKCYQMNKIVVNQIKEAQEKKERKNRVEQRRKFVQQQQQKHESECFSWLSMVSFLNTMRQYFSPKNGQMVKW